MRSVVALLGLLVGLLVAAPAAAQEGYARLQGDDRIETAIAISDRYWPEGADAVLLARSDDFPDALSGGPLADRLDAPILLTPPSGLDTRVAAELERLSPTTVYVLGGTSALNSKVEAALDGYGVERLWGSDRYGTSQAVDAAINSDTGDAVVASGEKFPDALMAIDLLPTRILLSQVDTFPAYTPGYSYTLIGGEAVIGRGVQNQTGGTRLAGTDRYLTAAKVLDASVNTRGAGPLFVATGADAPDALAAGGAVAKTGGYLLIVDPGLGLRGEQADVLTRHRADFDEIVVLGGTSAVPDRMVEQVVDTIGGSQQERDDGDDDDSGDDPGDDVVPPDVSVTFDYVTSRGAREGQTHIVDLDLHGFREGDTAKLTMLHTCTEHGPPSWTVDGEDYAPDTTVTIGGDVRVTLTADPETCVVLHITDGPGGFSATSKQLHWDQRELPDIDLEPNVDQIDAMVGQPIEAITVTATSDNTSIDVTVAGPDWIDWQSTPAVREDGRYTVTGTISGTPTEVGDSRINVSVEEYPGIGSERDINVVVRAS